MSSTAQSKTIQNPTREPGNYPRPETTYQQTFVPPIDIWEGRDELVLYADMPGVRAEDIDIRFENRELTIHGPVAPRYENLQLLHAEYSIGDFHRTFVIGEAIDSENISASMSDGVLTLHLPKAEKVKPRRISVKAK